MRKPLRTPLALAIGMASSMTYAQEAAQAETAEASSGLEEVVVTAQKREQNLQDTPIAIAAFDAQTLEDQQVKDISDLSSSIPNVQIVPAPGGSTGATIAIRGSSMINPAVTWEPSVGIYVDGVFVAKNMGGLFDVAELERVEVLRGPQGTLYGKNTTGGAVSLVSRKPAEEFGGKVKAGAGNYGYTEYSLSVDSGKLGGVASFNVAYDKRDRDGFYDNTLPVGEPMIDEFKKLDSEAGRIAALFDVTDALEISYAYDWSERNNTVAFGQFEPGIPSASAPGGFKPAKTERLDEGSLDGAGEEKSETSGHTLNIAWDISDTLMLKSITGVREMNFFDSNDYDGFPIVGFHTDRDISSDQVSQEFQLVGQVGDINYVLGAFYFNEDSDAVNPFIVGGAPVDNRYGVDATSYALFGQVDWMVTDLLTLTFGARWTEEEKDSYVSHNGSALVMLGEDYSAKASDKWNNVSPMMVASYAFTDEITGYAKVSQGWKAGGFNGEALNQVQAETPYDEETLTSYEVGMKSRWLDNRLQANVAIFYNDIEDMQVSNYLGAYSIVENAGEAKVTGFELETMYAITDSLTAFFNYGYLDSSYDEYVIVTGTGNVDIAKDAEFPYSPESKYSLGLEHVAELGFAQLRTRIDYSYTDSQFFYAEQPKANLTAAEDFSLLNARIAMTDIAVAGDNTLEFGIWGKNLTDEEYRLNGIPGTDAMGNFVAGINYYGDPRTMGADVTFKF